MNNYSVHSYQPVVDRAENQKPMLFGKRLVQPWIIYSYLGIVAVVLFALVGFLGMSFRSESKLITISAANNKAVLNSLLEEGEDAADLISKLKYYGLWQLPASGKVPPFFIKNYPVDLHTIRDINIRKRVFLHTLLPQALFVRQEALQRRNKFESILGKIDCSQEDLDFGKEMDGQCAWTTLLAENEIDFIHDLCRRYRTTSAKELLERVNAVPTSIILAQGALESSWGISRFTREGNSIFGMWTWKTAGITPARREEGKTHRVKVYESILDSVRAYQLTLNRYEPYDLFRQLRMQTDDPLILADGLTSYSERGEEYVAEIKKIILSNNLQKYDKCILTDMNLPEFLRPAPKSSSPGKPGNAAL